uniref:Uncharacterized protein n=1 Tax=Romanomermis culicivorax TaxID=13658 RepID=A0A915K7Q5_ROMCU
MDNADPRSEESHVAIVQMIAVDDQIFSVVEDPCFINLIKKPSTYQLKGRKSYKRLIWKQYDDLKNRLKFK